MKQVWKYICGSSYKTNKNVVIVLGRKGLESVTQEDFPKITTIYERKELYQALPRIVDLFQQTYNKTWWIIQTSKWDITYDALVDAGATGMIYMGDIGFERALEEAK